MARRTVESHGAFLLPHLRPAGRVLDLGCGPGTITAGLAARLSHGSVLGVDMNPAQIARARALACERGLSNVAFEVRSAAALALPDASFDLIFAHAVFEHLAAPVTVLRELRAALKSGGLMALRSPDWGGFVVYPECGGLAAALSAYEDLQKGNGGDLRAGRRLGGWLEEAGFASVRRSASYEFYDDVDLIASYFADQLAAADKAEAATTWRAWARLPGAMFAQAWFEAIAVRPVG